MLTLFIVVTVISILLKHNILTNFNPRLVEVKNFKWRSDEDKIAFKTITKNNGMISERLYRNTLKTQRNETPPQCGNQTTLNLLSVEKDQWRGLEEIAVALNAITSLPFYLTSHRTFPFDDK